MVSYLYTLFIAMDANFRMKQRFRGNAKADLPLGPGLGYQVDEGPYLEFLKGYTSEKDVRDLKLDFQIFIEMVSID